jgi:hypothetical protein
MDANQRLSQQVIDDFVGVAHGDCVRVKELLSQHPGLVKARASWDELGIEAAVQTGRVEIAEYLLESGASLDIFRAAMLGRAETVERSSQADPSLVKANGVHNIPILNFPVIGGYLEIARTLLTSGADIAAGDGRKTALHGAVLFG